ncbi:lysylphosphatidylglycerol synthase transmembrane domain-containing protein [Hippea alviniae]|uniref:lysylphosphatidylglycerol synthase transmembrane domain-containing protein n=1 Tax=Hippea alviniae TaxID=1279027 RepID=UPI0003B794C9|nr:lysylphosphatidylglycerol synthase transmembrane domain-containing protein [Hippea alviniae]
MLKTVIKLIVSILLIILLFNKIDMHQLKETIVKVGLFDFLLLCFLYLSAQFISSIRWKLVIKSLGKNEDFLSLFKLYLMGMFANLFLPSIIGGDAIKGYILSKKIGIRQSISSIFLERYNGLVALLLLSLISVLLFFKLFGIKIALSIISINIFAFVSVYMLKFIKHKKVSLFYNDIVLFHKSKEFYIVSALSVFIQIINILIYVCVGQLTNLNINIAYYFAFIPIITLISFLPISFNGIGVREFSFVYLFKYAGLSPAQAVSLSLIVFFVSVACSLIGGVFYLSNGRVVKEAKEFHR